MKICRYDDGRIGLVQGDAVRDVTAVLEMLGTFTYPLPKYDPFIARLGSLRERIEETATQAKPVPLAKVKLLAPLANPGKIIAAPVNYTRHLQEASPNRPIPDHRHVRDGQIVRGEPDLHDPARGRNWLHHDGRRGPRRQGRRHGRQALLNQLPGGHQVGARLEDEHDR